MTQQYGFRSTRNLAEVEDRDECLDNLGIDRRDLSILVGTGNAGVTSGDYNNCQGLTSSLESQITALSAIPGPLITTLSGKIKKAGDTGITTISGTTLNNDRGYYNTTFGIFSTSTSSFFSTVSGSDYTNGGQYLLGNVSFPSGVTASGITYKGTTLAWNSYFIRYPSYFQLKDSGDVIRYLPLYLAPPSALTSNVIWLDGEYSQFGLSGTSVSEWRDVLGRTSAVQSTASLQPTRATSEINDKPGVRFDGSNDSLSLGFLNGALPSAATLVVVFSLTNPSVTGDTDYAVLTNVANSSASWSGSWGLFTTGLVSGFPSTYPVNGTCVVSIRCSATYGLEYRLNGVRTDYRSTGFTFGTSGEFLIGGRRVFGGTIHALALYNEVLDDKTLTAQEEYFRWRYGFVYDPDAADMTYTRVLHDENLSPVQLEDGTVLEVG